jgi:mono/diheme cytochrome c family protein
MQNIIDLISLIAIAALPTWSRFRVWRVRSSFLKWGSVGLAAVLAIAVSSVSALLIPGMVKQHARSTPIPDLKVEATPERIARGKALVDGFCSACHSTTGTLTGGFEIGGKLRVAVGSFVASNLTPARPLQHWSDGEIFRAIRNSVSADGRWLMIMSYTNADRLSDDDIEAVIAYIRSVPAAGRQTPEPPDRLNLLGVAMLGAGLLPSGKPVITGNITAPPKGRPFNLANISCRTRIAADATAPV